ncbi:hypothetical protein NC651_017152 [Populus alba x Populus x berolinensis]|nr:hypothetical protein NC651_017152 [Populus alba x Populus x berolinensis]
MKIWFIVFSPLLLGLYLSYGTQVSERKNVLLALFAQFVFQIKFPFFSVFLLSSCSLIPHMCVIQAFITLLFRVFYTEKELLN